jgi:Fe-S cluster assembly scaffold protein SufB
MFWQEFNIKTFLSETLVFRDGVFCPELSDYNSLDFKDNTVYINKTPKIPVHIIYIGEIAGNIDLNIDINAENTNIFMTFKTFCKKPAFLNIFVKNAGKNSVFDGKIIIKNESLLKLNVKGVQNKENTGIFVKTKVAAYKNSENFLQGISKIEKNIENCNSDISFSVLADETAKITMSPIQYINSVPLNASHSASIYKPTDNQINYLRTSGLSGLEINNLLEKAFIEQE